jgi:hypothetical protein
MLEVTLAMNRTCVSAIISAASGVTMTRRRLLRSIFLCAEGFDEAH